jgi:predicted negative regulator of RcsB-dependent stress response
MKKKITILVLLILVLALIGYNYMYKNHRDISAETVSYSVSVEDIYTTFQADEKSANAKYIDKTIEIYGKITNIDLQNKIITVDEKLSARLTNSVPANLKLQNVIVLKGRLTGYDDLLGEIQMDQCTIKP